MPIKWSAVKVNEAMDEVKAQVLLADQFIAEARANLPGYMEDRICRLIGDIDRIDYVKAAIEATRNAIPAGAIEAEQKHTRHGSTRSLM